MTREPSEELPDGLKDLLRLDASDEGPALPLSGAETDAMVSAVMRDFAAPQTRPLRKPRTWLWMVAAMLLMVGSAAAYFVAVPRQPATPKTANPRSTGAFASRASMGEAAANEETVRRAQDLLAEANALRAQGKFAEAASAYQRAAVEAQDAATGQVARVAAADLQLERLGDARMALRLYRQARALEGPLSPEAEAGEQRALRALDSAR